MNFQEKLPLQMDLMNIHVQIITEYHRKIQNKDQQWQEDQFSMGIQKNLLGLQWTAPVPTETLIMKVTVNLVIL